MLFILVLIGLASMAQAQDFKGHEKILVFIPHVRCRSDADAPEWGRGARDAQCLLQLRVDQQAPSAMGDNITLVPAAPDEANLSCYVGRFAYSAIEAIQTSSSITHFFKVLQHEHNSIQSHLGERLGLRGLGSLKADEQRIPGSSDFVEALNQQVHFRTFTNLGTRRRIENLLESAPFARMSTVNAANWKNCLNHAGGVHYNRSADVDNDKRCSIPEFLTHLCFSVDGRSLAVTHGCSGLEGGDFVAYSRLARASSVRLSLRDGLAEALLDPRLWVPLTVQVCDVTAVRTRQEAVESLGAFVLKIGPNFADENVQHNDIWQAVVQRNDDGPRATYLTVVAGLVLFMVVTVSLVFIFVRR